MTKNRFIKYFAFCFFAFAFCFTAFSQTLTVRDIMREPSLAGMRPDGERLSPDGKLVAFAWNSEGKEPRNLYLTSTGGGGAARIIVDAEKNYEMRTPAPESKLNYGLIVRDDFAKAREKNLGGAEFSPDSKRLLFAQNGDIYVLDLEKISASSETQKESIKIRWENLESALIRRADLIPNIIKLFQSLNVQEQEIFGQVLNARIQLMNAINSSSKVESVNKTQQQKEGILASSEYLSTRLTRLIILQEVYPALRSSETFQKFQDELLGTEDRIKVSRLDYNDSVNNLLEPNPRRITRTQGAEFSARWLDNETILYQSGGNFFALNIEKTFLVQLSREANPQTFVSVSFAVPTEDARMLAYVVSDGSKQRALFVPNYLDEFVQAPTFRRGFTEQRVLVTKTDGSLERPFEVKIPKAEGASYLRGIDWAADNRSLIVDRVDRDTKRRQLFYVFNVGGADEQTILIHEEIDPKWIGRLSAIVEPHPTDSARIVFASEKDGFNHLYLATLEKGKIGADSIDETRRENSAGAELSSAVKIKQLTAGSYEIEWAKWRGGEQIVFSSTEGNAATREFYTLNSEGGGKQKLFSTDAGMRTAPQLSTKGDENFLLYNYSRWNAPTELYAQRVCSECRGATAANKLTDSTPERFKQTKWSAPQFISFKSKDGKQISAKIYLPDGFDKTKKYPSVVFVHGAGYLQNVINGWNNYYREFMFHTILTRKGYVVIDIDYRGSAGYGRDFRTDVYDFLGGLDYEDHLDAIDFAVKNYAVDERRVGVYGGSYGGFMAGMLVMRAPDKIAAAAALRPVFDWKNYFASSAIYTTERLGFPDKNPEAYRRSSPISYADKLQKPLLILHGMVDDNVPAQDSIQLIEKLIRLEKTPYFEAMFYPSENHGFARPTSWADEYERILTFFEKHLK